MGMCSSAMNRCREKVRAFANDLSTFATANPSIQFPLEKPLPLPLICKITAFREKDRKWKT
jgi:uncharacterized protein YdhG (YjbR/CyaY superfamily)